MREILIKYVLPGIASMCIWFATESYLFLIAFVIPVSYIAQIAFKICKEQSP